MTASLASRLATGPLAAISAATSFASSSHLPGGTTRYAKQQLNFWRDLAWHETVNHARDWLALSMLGEEAQGAVRAFVGKKRDG